ncbi:hypothetical protein [Cylindrospermopsis raciborskii]|uniref:hypothetical protein n=1 Tax=Cylindrospermopsis raciborskii TaxID=77022 RepID=UPI001143734F|nr:hypothetical protein [Cylindrospermopsis raciborskii]TPX27622.1 hypothetical protein FIV49_15750 [Cylindrospermopsis raciborskii GIHE 2018]
MCYYERETDSPVENTKSANNELWRLFSARAEVVEEAISHYQESYRKSEYSILMQQLYEFYIKEKLPMTYTLEQFKKDFVISHLREVRLRRY